MDQKNIDLIETEMDKILGEIFSQEETHPELFTTPPEVTIQEKTHSLLPLTQVMDIVNSDTHWGKWFRGDFNIKGLDSFALMYWDNNDNGANKPWYDEFNSFINLWRDAINSKTNYLMGYFKDYDRCTREELFEIFTGRLSEVHENGMSGLQLWINHFPDFFNTWSNGGPIMTEEWAVEVLSCRLWFATFGITHEQKVHDLLTEKYKFNDSLKYKEAPNSMEGRGVDGLLIDRITGEIDTHISIKAGGGLSKKFLRDYHKKHSLTDLYIGFSNDTDSELTYLTPRELES